MTNTTKPDAKEPVELSQLLEKLESIEGKLTDVLDTVELLPDLEDVSKLVQREGDSLEERIVRRIIRGS